MYYLQCQVKGCFGSLVSISVWIAHTWLPPRSSGRSRAQRRRGHRRIVRRAIVLRFQEAGQPCGYLFGRARRRRKALQSAAEGRAERREPEPSEACDDASSHSSDAWEHVDTGELSCLKVLQTRAAAVLVVLMHEHLLRSDVRITPAKLEGECARRPAHASATYAYRRDQNHKLTPPCLPAQAVGTACARRSGHFHPWRCALRSPDP